MAPAHRGLLLLNFPTAVLAVSTLTDGLLAVVIPVEPWSVTPVPTPLWAAVLLLAAVVLVLSVRPVRNRLS